MRFVQRTLPRVFFCLILILPIWIAFSTSTKSSEPDPRVAQGLAAWEQVYSVLVSPRCINCHTATNYPQQGDDRHRHFANVIRGRGGRGVPGLSCATCHQ